MNDDQLNELIRQTHPQPDFSKSFQREVWARIAVAEQQSWSTQWRRISEFMLGWLAQPAPAVALVMTMLLVGVGAGMATASGSQTDALRSAYITSINPVAAPHAPSRE